VRALETVATALEVLFSSEFAGVCEEMIETLRGHVRPLRLTNAGFLADSVERKLVLFFRNVSKEDKCLAFPESDVTCPRGCAALLKAMLAELVKDLTDVARATVLEKQYTVRVARRRERGVEPGAVVKGAAKVPSPELEGSKGEAVQCGSHLGQLLKAVKKNGTPLSCAKGESCKFKHGKLSDLSKEAAISLVESMPPWMRSCVSPLIGSAKGFKS
jgi:hypothetical protein